MAGDAISFNELVKICRYYMAKEGYPLGPRRKRKRNEQNLALGLKPMVAELVLMKVLIPGYTFKCRHCSHKGWYAIEEVSLTIKCSGCMEHFALPVDPAISYRLSTLVKKSFYKTPTQPDGNAAVIGSLIRLAKRTRMTFDFSGVLRRG